MSASEAAPTPVAADPSTGHNSNSLPTPRRRTVIQTERTTHVELLSDRGIHGSNAVNVTDGKDTNHVIRGETALDRSKETPSRKGVPASAVTPRRRKVVMRTEQPGWERCISVTAKLSLLILGIVGLIKLLSWHTNDSAPFGLLDYENKLAEIEGSLKATTKMMQVQVEAIDRKIEGQLGSFRKEVIGKVEEQSVLLGHKIKKLEDKGESLEKKLKEMEFLSKEEVSQFLKELVNNTNSEIGDQELNWDKVRTVARDIVMKEIEKHAADGLGKVDYALASGGGKIIKHSEPYYAAKLNNWFSSKGGAGVHPRADKMLEPSFGEPGQCFPLKGSSGFVEIKLRTAIIPEAITLEHVAKSVAYDRTSAPKEFRVSGWIRGSLEEASPEPDKMVLLGEFVYDLERSFVQTFHLNPCTAASCVVDVIRLDVLSNHGNSLHTCIYRLRVHGSESDSIVPVPGQS
ncbi:SUN domain-containing protein 1-like [Nymphaea colorata]|nr:SUN domain-containing protein 1-like [Nymphaea colorata]XP_031474254.1 SUN domain-containing protein 1-like [Nymphaea colorata]